MWETCFGGSHTEHWWGCCYPTLQWYIKNPLKEFTDVHRIYIRIHIERVFSWVIRIVWWSILRYRIPFRRLRLGAEPRFFSLGSRTWKPWLLPALRRVACKWRNLCVWRRRSIIFFSILRVDRLSCADPPTQTIGTPLSMPSAVPQALAVLPQIIKHPSNHGHLHWPALDSSCPCFNWLNFFSIFVYFGLNLSPSAQRGSMEMPTQSSMKFLATAAVSIKLFMVLVRNFSSNKSINNAVESSFQSLLDLDGAGGAVWGTMNKGSEELEPIIIWDRKPGSWDGSMVRKTEENTIQRFFLRNTVPVLCAVRKTEENVI